MLLDRLPIHAETTVVFVGDYIDRGPDSRQVIDVLLELGQRCNVVCLRGNHEAMLLAFLEDPESNMAGLFIYNGGSATLASYGDSEGNYEIPTSHRRFFSELRVSYEDPQAFFVHAGVPDMPLSELDENRDGHKMMWMRGAFLTSTYDWGKPIVHGHTPVTDVQLAPNRINVDTGCVFMHRLSAVSLPSREVISVRRRQRRMTPSLRDSRSSRQAVRFRGRVAVRVVRGDTVIQLETLDYSPIGMLARLLVPQQHWAFGEHETVQGLIGNDGGDVVAFTGVVVRRERRDEGECYGIRILP